MSPQGLFAVLRLGLLQPTVLPVIHTQLPPPWVLLWPQIPGGRARFDA